MDLRLYKYVNKATKLEEASINDAPATGLEVMANKVAKYMLTSRGSDALEPDYGSHLTIPHQVSKAYIPRLYVELNADLQDCLKYIRKYETGSERLSQLILKEIVYNPDVSTSRIDIYVEIITSAGRRALIAVPNS